MNEGKQQPDRNSNLTVHVDKSGREYVDTKELLERPVVKQNLSALERFPVSSPKRPKRATEAR